MFNAIQYTLNIYLQEHGLNGAKFHTSEVIKFAIRVLPVTSAWRAIRRM